MSTLNKFEAYLRELDGAVGLLAQAQDATGDERHAMLNLAAEAWHAARDVGGFSHYAVDARLSEFEVEHMATAGVLPRIYLEMIVVYLEMRLAKVRRAYRMIGGVA